MKAAHMDHELRDDEIVSILVSVHTIAVVGASPNPARASHGVSRFLVGRGYEVWPVHPGLAGKTIVGRPVVASLAEIPVAIDMVDVFRRAEALPALADEVLALDPLPKVFWAQLGIRNDAVAARLAAAGIRVVMNRCPAIEYGRLGPAIEALRGTGSTSG